MLNIYEPPGRKTGLTLYEPWEKKEEKSSTYGWTAAEANNVGFMNKESAQRSTAHLLSFIPYAKYLMPTAREEFTQMEPYEQVRELAWESVGAALMVGGGIILKSAGKAANGLQKFLQKRQLMDFRPIEEATTTLIGKGGIWRGYEYQSAISNQLKASKFAQDEADTIARIVAQGEDTVALKALAWEKGDKLSKAWKKTVGQLGDTLGDGINRRELIIPENLAKHLTPNAVRSRHARKLYKDNLKLAYTNPNTQHLESLMEHHAKKMFGDEMMKNWDLGLVTDEQLANLSLSMFESKGFKTISRAHRIAMGNWLLPWARPERHLYGSAEAVFATKSRLYDVLVDAKRASNGYSIDKLNMLKDMLVERNFGKISTRMTETRFIPNKELWTDDTLNAANKILREIDNFAEAKRKGILTQVEYDKVLQKTLRDAGEKSPVVTQLIEVVRDYTDILYKDMVQTYVPKVFDDMPLNSLGRMKVNVLSNYWGSKVEELFKSSISSREKIKGVKKLLTGYQEILTDKKYLKPILSKNEQKEVMELAKGFTYGSGAKKVLPEYLDGYMPRIMQNGQDFADRAKKALVGEASYMKHRQLTTRQPDQMLGLMETLEARTKAQGKQIYFYGEANKAIDYAKTLPQAWREHLDFTLSRMIGQPSTWDQKLATALSGMRIFGELDSYKAMELSRRITGLAYTGMLGLRPFAAFRNLTQTPLMTPTELGGGIKDLTSTVRGLGYALSKDHRKYIQEIGAITEFVPEQAMKPAFPGTGIGAKYDTMKDAFMYFFQQSDRFNRYWSGGAALDKWDWAVKNTVGGTENISAFARKVGLQHRADWSKVQIENALRAGKVDEAKSLFIKDIIADTQYLYGGADAPSMMGTGGAQRLLTTFQSWWMNYGTAISRWATTGTGEERVKRMAMAMITGAMVEQMLAQWAGHPTAVRSIGIGPFPLGDAGMPPALEPIWHLMGAAKNTVQGELMQDDRTRAKAYSQFKQTLESTTNLVIPGGLMINQGLKGYRQEGDISGILAGILQRKKD